MTLLCYLVQGDPVLHIPPCPVYDLRAGFHLHGFCGAGDLVFHDLDVVWGVPLPLAILLYPLLGMDNIIMNDPRHLQSGGQSV